MNIATGVDLIEIDRISTIIHRHGERFLSRVYTPKERMETNEKAASLAARFAAKEAVSKALGTGIGAVKWTDIEICHSPSRQPILHLHGNAAALAKQLSLDIWSVSLSHTQTHAIAMVTAISSLPHE